MTTHWPTDPDAGVHLGTVADCGECAGAGVPQNGPLRGQGAIGGLSGASGDPREKRGAKRRAERFEGET